MFSAHLSWGFSDCNRYAQVAKVLRCVDCHARMPQGQASLSFINQALRSALFDT